MKKIFSLLVVLIMGAVAFAGDFQVYKLDNGQNVIIQQVKNNPIVTIDTWIKTGSINETNKKIKKLRLHVHRSFLKFLYFTLPDKRFRRAATPRLCHATRCGPLPQKVPRLL